MTETDPAYPSYRSIISDWTEFQDTCRRSQPDFFRVNRLKTTIQNVLYYLREQSLQISSIPNLEGVYCWEEATRPASETVLHWNGLLHIGSCNRTAFACFEPSTR